MSANPPANWYPDPEDPTQQRYWDGAQWTEHRAPAAGAAQPPSTGVPTAGWPATPGSTSGPAFGQQPAAGQPQPYAQPYATSASANGLAITSLVVAIVSFFLAFIAIGALGGILAVVLGIVAMRQISASNGAQGGKGLAISGIIVGAISALIGMVVFVFLVFIGTAVETGFGEFGDFLECMERQAETDQDLDC